MAWTLLTPSSVAHTCSTHHNTKHGRSYISPAISPSLAYHTRAALSEKSCTVGKHRQGLPQYCQTKPETMRHKMPLYSIYRDVTPTVLSLLHISHTNDTETHTRMY